MDNKTVLMVVVAIVLGMLVANMFKDVCGCKVVEGQCEDGAMSQNHECLKKDRLETLGLDNCDINCSEEGNHDSECCEWRVPEVIYFGDNGCLNSSYATTENTPCEQLPTCQQTSGLAGDRMAISVTDLLHVLSNYHNRQDDHPNEPMCKYGDLNEDNFVGVDDVLAVLAKFHYDCGATDHEIHSDACSTCISDNMLISAENSLEKRFTCDPSNEESSCNNVCNGDVNEELKCIRRRTCGLDSIVQPNIDSKLIINSCTADSSLTEGGGKDKFDELFDPIVLGYLNSSGSDATESDLNSYMAGGLFACGTTPACNNPFPMYYRNPSSAREGDTACIVLGAGRGSEEYLESDYIRWASDCTSKCKANLVTGDPDAAFCVSCCMSGPDVGAEGSGGGGGGGGH